MTANESVPLTGGRMTAGVTRHGSTVRRPTGPWSPAVHDLLRYLERSVPVDTNWEPGRGFRLAPYARTSHALAGAGELLRVLHSVAVAFVPSEVNYRYHPHPVAFIDWDGAQPVTPLAELAAAAWAFVPLAPPSRLRQAGFDPLPDLPDRLRTFVAGELRWLDSITAELAAAL